MMGTKIPLRVVGIKFQKHEVRDVGLGFAASAHLW